MEEERVEMGEWTGHRRIRTPIRWLVDSALACSKIRGDMGTINNCKTDALMPEIKRLFAVRPMLTYKEMVRELGGVVCVQTLRGVRRRLGMVRIGITREYMRMEKGNEKWEMLWEDYVKVKGNLAWPDGMGAEEPVHESCCTGKLLEKLEVICYE